MIRVHLVSEDDEPLTMLLPATADMRLDTDGPEPWLFRGRWDSITYYGEARMASTDMTLFWSDGDLMSMDMTADVPTRVGRVFTVASNEGKFRYTVRDVESV
jgi:hypothetical protein